MVKIFCDRCGKEIKEEFYSVNIYKEGADSKYTIDACAVAIANAASSLENNIFNKLNSKKMYCEKCKDEFKAFLNLEQ